MARAISVRLDDDADKALRTLEATGMSQSEAIRAALLGEVRHLRRSMAPTSRCARAASFRPEAKIDGEATRILVEQIGAVDAERLGDLAGHLTREEI